MWQSALVHGLPEHVIRDPHYSSFEQLVAFQQLVLEDLNKVVFLMQVFHGAGWRTLSAAGKRLDRSNPTFPILYTTATESGLDCRCSPARRSFRQRK